MRRLGTGPGVTFERGVRLLAGAILLVFAVFALRLFQLQIVESDALRQRSERNSIRSVRLAAPRGEILDREGRTLATTRPAFALQVIPSELRRPEVTLAALGRLVGKDPERLRREIGTARGLERYQPVELASDLSRSELARVESHRYALPGVITDLRARRHYVHGSLAAHVLGSIGEIRRGQLKTREFAGYRAGELVGQSGLEAVLEPHLRGRAGGRNVVVDVAGREVELVGEVDPVPGGTAVLSLDLDLQQAAEQAFESEEPGEPPQAGALVALDPRSGEVLALVSSPSYDPNDFVGGIDPDTWRRLSTSERRPLQNRAISGLYPPASTYKAVVAAAALEEELIGRSEPLYCPGYFRLGRRIYRCWKHAGHGWLDLHGALVHSCDVYFYQVGRRLEIDRLAFFARGFGLGRPTGIELPGEQSGHVPTSAWKERRFAEPWLPGETLSAAIGQGFNTVTPLQLAVAYAAIANGGRLVTPRLILRLERRDGSLSEKTGPVFRGKVPVSPEALAEVKDALVGVVNERRGTGARARLPGITVAGKTGTAQLVGREHLEEFEDEEDVPSRYRDHAWFAAFAPAEDPEIAVSVLVEHGGSGGAVAAPIARRVLERYFEKHPPPGVEPPGRSPEPAPPAALRAQAETEVQPDAGG